VKNDFKAPSIISGAVFSLAPIVLLIQNIPAYIDAGTGSLIIQFLIAGVVGGLFLIKVFWRKVKAFFSNLFSRANRSTD